MQIVDNKALVLRTRNPDKYKVIQRMAVVGENEGVYEVAVKWGLDEVAVLRNLGVRDVPSPIIARYNWPGRYKPMKHQIETASFQQRIAVRLYFLNRVRVKRSQLCGLQITL